MHLWLTALGVLLCSVGSSIALGDETGPHQCEYYIADSLVPGFGRGVFTGQPLRENETMFESATILVRNILAMETMLAYYVFTDDNDDYEILMFGPMLMLNHMDNETVDYAFAEYPVAPPRQVLHTPHTTHTAFQAISLENTSQGSELFTNYGKRWFKDRRIKRNTAPTNASTAYSLPELQQHGRCLTDVVLGDSSLPFAGKGVFANKPFRAGEVVSVSPALVLPRHAVEQEGEHSVLINYCITSSSEDEDGGERVSDVALFPLSLAGMMNHGAGDMANVAMDWYEWPGDVQKREGEQGAEGGRLHTWTAQQLEEAQFAPLDLQFVATRDIAQGEELLISYGPAWEQAWVAYLDAMLEWHEMLALMDYLGKERDMEATHMLPPQFRAPLEAPPGMFPASFFAEEAQCLGPIPCEGWTGDDRVRQMHGPGEMAEVVRARAFAGEHFVMLGGAESEEEEEEEEKQGDSGRGVNKNEEL